MIIKSPSETRLSSCTINGCVLVGKTETAKPKVSKSHLMIFDPKKKLLYHHYD